MRFPALGAFLRFSNNNIIPVRARDGTPNEENIVGFPNLDDLKILAGALDLAHMTRHPHPAHDSSRKQALADCTGTTVPSFGTVRRVASGEGMTTNNTFKTAAFGHANRIDIISGGEQRCADDVTGLHFFGEIAKFLDAFHSNA